VVEIEGNESRGGYGVEIGGKEEQALVLWSKWRQKNYQEERQALLVFQGESEGGRAEPHSGV